MTSVRVSFASTTNILGMGELKNVKNSVGLLNDVVVDVSRIYACKVTHPDHQSEIWCG